MGIVFSGLDELALSMEELADIPESVINEMLVAGAEVVEKAQLASGMAAGVNDTGMTLHSLKTEPPKGKKVKIKFEGSRPNGNKTKRNAEVAFLNEYGVPSKGMPAKNWIQNANEAAADAMTEAEAEIYSAWVNSLGL